MEKKIAVDKNVPLVNVLSGDINDVILFIIPLTPLPVQKIFPSKVIDSFELKSSPFSDVLGDSDILINGTGPVMVWIPVFLYSIMTLGVVVDSAEKSILLSGSEYTIIYSYSSLFLSNNSI